MTNYNKIIELKAEGGSITLFQCFDEKNQDWYYYNIQEMSYENLDLSGINKNSKYSMSLAEVFIKMQAEYNNVFSLYPLQVHPDYKKAILGLLQEYVNKVDRNIQHYQWAKVLGITETDLIKKLKV